MCKRTICRLVYTRNETFLHLCGTNKPHGSCGRDYMLRLGTWLGTFGTFGFLVARRIRETDQAADRRRIPLISRMFIRLRGPAHERVPRNDYFLLLGIISVSNNFLGSHAGHPGDNPLLISINIFHGLKKTQPPRSIATCASLIDDHDERVHFQLGI
ncbi:hypothetical protein RSAG8_08085, partial [Rhizoctonia solani AG-8 WAC10335]